MLHSILKVIGDGSVFHPMTHISRYDYFASCNLMPFLAVGICQLGQTAISGQRVGKSNLFLLISCDCHHGASHTPIVKLNGQLKRKL